MIAEREGRAPLSGNEVERLCAQVERPTLIIHGSDDRCQPVVRGQRLAELTDGDLVVLDGAGHLPQARDPVKVIRLITDFMERIAEASMRTTTWTRGRSRAKRACTYRHRSEWATPAATWLSPRN
jgi:hypothetical protein